MIASAVVRPRLSTEHYLEEFGFQFETGELLADYDDDGTGLKIIHPDQPEFGPAGSGLVSEIRVMGPNSCSKESREAEDYATAQSEKKYTAYEANGLHWYHSPAERPMDNMVTLSARGFGND